MRDFSFSDDELRSLTTDDQISSLSVDELNVLIDEIRKKNFKLIGQIAASVNITENKNEVLRLDKLITKIKNEIKSRN